MSATCANLAPHDQRRGALTGAPLLAGGLCAASLAAFLAGWLPLGFSIVTVFLFAGPHNWIEARYFLTRLPPRWGRLRPFFLTAFAGVLGLTAAFAALPWLTDRLGWSDSAWYVAQATWNSALALWILALVLMRSRQNPRRDWGWTAPVAFVLMALTWVSPNLWGLGLVYAHPLMAFWILDRELKRSRPHWRPAYHLLLTVVPLLLALLWWRLADTPDLPGTDALTARITQHAGAGLLGGVSSHLLVATHTFLEMLHYGVWVVVIPLVAFRSAPWKPREIPLARRSPLWARAVVAILVLGGLLVLTLWGAFLADYPLTRDVYFTAALLHVLAEVPFLLRAL
jgi:hypothetical protein